MDSRTSFVAALAATILIGSTCQAQDRKTVEVISFERDVKPILRKRCANCHNAERPRGELDLTSFAGVNAGGAGGKVAAPGNIVDSPIYTMSAHLEDPKMPPNAPKIPQKEIDTIRKWIEGGMVEKAGDAATASSPGRPEVPAPTLVTPETSPRAASISALAVSPVAPIAVVSGHRQVLVFDIAASKLLGALPFPEGDVFTLRFSGDGQTLLAAGGIGADSGKVVLFRTKDWSRESTVGDEVDAILAADLAPDRAKVAIGGPTRVVKILTNPAGEVLQTFRKPTDWITATAFSPDGLLVASGDRFGGLFLIETRTGQEFLAMKGHPKAITSIAWTQHGDGLYTAGEDGSIQLFDLHSGKVQKRWDAHAGGVLSVAVNRSTGRIASCGRDRRVKVWGVDTTIVIDLGPASDATTRLGWTADGKGLVVGDLSGEVRLWNLLDGTSKPLPMPVAARPLAIAMVAPVLAPARPFTPKPASIASRPATPSPSIDDLDAALASARQTLAAAEQTVARLTRLSRARSRGNETSSTELSPSTTEALSSVTTALSALRLVLEADPTNPTLARAVEETERAVKALEQKRDRLNSANASPREGR